MENIMELNSQRYQVLLTPSASEKLEDLSVQLKRTRSDIIRLALEEYFAKYYIED